MRAIHLIAYGNPAENLKMVEVSEPNAPSASEALVRTEYAPIDYSDLLLANGVYFLKPKLPSVIGGEPSVDAKTASVLNINPTTAVLLLDEFVKLKAKDWIVLNAANSHVARCLIAIAKSRDLSVVGIVRRPELIPEIEKLNVDFVGVELPELSKQIQTATRGMPISLGLDAVGGPATATLASVLSPGAHLVSYAWLSGLPIHVPQGDLIGKRLNIHGFWMYYEEYLPKMRAALTEATKVVASGKLSLPITTTYKPSQIKEAIEHSERGGKVLLDFNHPK